MPTILKNTTIFYWSKQECMVCTNYFEARLGHSSWFFKKQHYLYPVCRSCMKLNKKTLRVVARAIYEKSFLRVKETFFFKWRVMGSIKRSVRKTMKVFNSNPPTIRNPGMIESGKMKKSWGGINFDKKGRIA